MVLKYISPISPIPENYPLKQAGNLYSTVLILSLLFCSEIIILEISSKEILKDT